jgi:DNA mismatch repair protein MutS2
VKDAWLFAQLDDFWLRYEPLSPWAKDERDARRVYTERAAIEARYDDLEAAASFLSRAKADPVALDRVAYHLKRMPRLPLASKDEYEFLELFQIKKFLSNYRSLLGALDAELRDTFMLRPVALALAAELDRGGSDAETFYLADSYSPELQDCRAGLARLDAELKSAVDAASAEIKGLLGLDFDGRDFLIAARAALEPEAIKRARCLAEPYDDERLLVRMAPRAELVALNAAREALLEREREAEAAVLRRLSMAAAAAMPELKAAVEAVTRWDLARAGALLAAATKSTRPCLGAGGLELSSGRFVPCQDECAALGLGYTPLDARFEGNAIVLFGSNMGGKTVALKTLLFMQLLAQTGLFVPAARFSTQVYADIQYIGELSGERLAGLSGFGFEVWRFQEAWAKGSGALVAFDEPARTTGSHEAEALLSALVEAYAQGQGRGGARALFATHFRGVARVPGAEYWRMRGLDRVAVGEALDAAAPLAERLSGINRHMRYELKPDSAQDPPESDALAIASMLGLDGSIVERAEIYFKNGSF